jgi:hypothetical protein
VIKNVDFHTLPLLEFYRFDWIDRIRFTVIRFSYSLIPIGHPVVENDTTIG